MREIARAVSKRIGFALVDEEIVLRAAAEAGVAPSVMADEERRRSFVERALSAIASDTPSLALAAGGFVVPESLLGGEMSDLIRTAIEETATRGRVVIVAHAASHALAAREDVLRVLVTASLPVRRSRVAAERNLTEKDAARAVDESDAGRADYLKRFYGARSELPTHYDLVVNTDRLTADEAVSLVTLAAGPAE